jgi:hypothetical protein
MLGKKKGVSNTTPVFLSILKIRTPYEWSTSGIIGYLYYYYIKLSPMQRASSGQSAQRVDKEMHPSPSAKWQLVNGQFHDKLPVINI